MRRFAIAALFAVLPGAAFAQSFEGNWECLKGPAPAGILTIYGTSYGFASQTFGDPSSGTGAINGFADGVQFFDGNLKEKAGIEAGRLVTVGTEVLMQLESATEIVMLCSPRVTYGEGQGSGPPPPAVSPPEILSPVVPPRPPGK